MSRCRPLLTLLILTVFTACKGKGIEDRLKAKHAERGDEARAAAEGLLTTYAKAMLDNMPAEGIYRTPDGDPAILQWRRLVAWAGIEKQARELSATYKETDSRRLILDAMVIVEALNEYWLGRVIAGLQGIDELGEERADGSDRVEVPLAEHMERLDELAKDRDGHDWLKVIDFERVLPYLLPVYRFLANGAGPRRNDVPFMGAVFELPPSDKRAVEESYRSYRDRVCAERVDGGCKVPYEHRDKVVMGAYIAKMSNRLEAYREKHPGFLQKVQARIRGDLKVAAKAARVPPEYPLLPDTMASWASPPLTQVFIGANGARFYSKGPRHDVQIDMLAAPKSWGLTAVERNKMGDEVSRLLGDVRDAGAHDLYYGELHLQLDRSVPVSVLTALRRVFQDGIATHAWFVGRRRHDGSLRRAAFGGAGVDKESALPIAVPLGDTTQVCRPVVGIGTDAISAADIRAHLVVDGNTLTLQDPPPPVVEPGKEPPAVKEPVRPPTPPRAPVTAALTGDRLKAVAMRRELRTRGEAVLLAVPHSMTYDQLHQLVNTVAIACDEPVCNKSRVTAKLLLAVCGARP